MNKFENIDIYTADPCVAMDMVARTPWIIMFLRMKSFPVSTLSPALNG